VTSEDNEDKLLRSVALRNSDAIRVARQRAEQQAEATLQEQANLLNLAHDSIFVRDMNGTIRYWNRAAEQLYGWTKEQAAGRVAHDLLMTAFPLSVEQIEGDLLRADHWEGELVHTRNDGSHVVVASRWSLQRDEQGIPVAIMETNSDITERKRAEKEARDIEQRYRALEMTLAHANRVATMGQLAASIVHEVSQPITAMVVNAEATLQWLARMPPDLEESRQLLATIIADGHRAAEVANRIRALIKKTPLRKDRLEINGAIRETIELTRGEAMKNCISVQTQLAEGLSPVGVDRIQLQQVMLNLIVNAVHALSECGQDRRELLISSSMSGSDDVAVSVRDSGPGISPEHVGRLFDPFYTTKPDGMGMGLSICHSIIEGHGGRIWATANVPQGAAFHFTIPTARE